MQELKYKKKTNFYEIQRAFNHYWVGKVAKDKDKTPKGRGYKQFKRWEWFWQQRVGKNGEFPRPNVLMEEWEKYLATHPEANNVAPTYNNLPLGDQLQEQGLDPAALASSVGTSGNWAPLGPFNSPGGRSGIGRLNCIAFHPTDVNTFWVGSASGGLWKTTTGGTSWTPLTNKLPVLGISAIAVNPSNPNIIYIATGDRNIFDTYSVGVLKSTNGGASWSATGLRFNVSERMVVNSLIIYPANPLILLAATTNGIYRTMNGGTTWTQEQAGYFQEILFKPGAPATVYASTRNYDSQVFRSTNTGDTWSQVTSFGGVNRIALAVTPANPDVVGALCSSDADGGFGGYYTSTNSGASFNVTYPTGKLNLLGRSESGLEGGGQGWYDLCVAISPTNARVVYAGGINTWKSTNGGTSWSLRSFWPGGVNGVGVVHADQQWMAFNPLRTGTLYQCNDGGLYKTSDGGATWTDLSNGLQITQLYRMGNSATNHALTLVGAQDNGTKLRKSSAYTDVLGGDGMEALIDYSDANIMYASTQNGRIYKSTDGGINFTEITVFLPPGAWTTPYVIDPVNPQTLYSGIGPSVYQSTNRGASWTNIGNGVSPNELQTLAVAPSNTKIIYAGSFADLHKTTTGGRSWSSVQLPLAFPLTSVKIHPTNPQIVWITYSDYGAGEKVYQTNDGGGTWKNISGTLPNVPANTLEYDKNTGVLYLGTDLGVFVRAPGMTDWKLFSAGLPNVIVTELEIQYSAGRLRAATYGRGLWESDLYGNATCTPVYTAGCANGNYINNFSFHTLMNNNSGCSNGQAPGYTIYPPAGTLTTAVARGRSHSLKVQSGSGSAQGFGVWIDYNNDRDFNDAGEFVYASPSASTSLFSATINIPATAPLGRKYMRVRSRHNGTFTGAQSCTAYTYGEAEDYTIAITEPLITWDKRFGGSGSDNLTSMIKTSDGGYLLGGFSASAMSGDKTEGGRGGQDYWIVKVSSTGTKQWDKRFGGAADDYLNTIIQTSDGGYLLGGTSLSGAGGDRTGASRGGRDYWIVKVSSTGTKQWDKRFGGAADDNLRVLSRLSTGEYLLTGMSASGAGGDKTQASRGGQDYWVVKISNTGTKVWDKRFGGTSDDFPEAAITTSDGGYLLGGRSASGSSGDHTGANWGSRDYWLVKISSTGTKVWDRHFGGYYDDDLYALSASSDGGYFLAGTSASSFSPDKTQPSRGGQDYWLIKVSSAGVKQWDKAFGGSGNDDLRSVAATSDGGCVLGGTSASGITGDKTEASRGGQDYWLVRVSSNGVKQWDKRFGGTASDEVRKVLLTANGSYLLGGISASGISGDKTQPSQGLADYWLVQVGSIGAAGPLAAASEGRVSAEAEDTPSNDGTGVLRVSPNPFTNRVTLQFTLTQPGQVSLKVYNEQGTEVANLYEGKAEGGRPYIHDWQPESHPAGLYFVRLVTENSMVHRKIVRIR